MEIKDAFSTLTRCDALIVSTTGKRRGIVFPLIIESDDFDVDTACERTNCT